LKLPASFHLDKPEACAESAQHLGAESTRRYRQTRWPFTKAHPGATALVAVLPRAPVAVVPARGADLMRNPFVPAAAAPRGPATTAPLGPAQPTRTTPAAHSTACAVGMTLAGCWKILEFSAFWLPKWLVLTKRARFAVGRMGAGRSSGTRF